MRKTKKIIFTFLISAFFLICSADIKPKSVYFSPDTPYLPDIEDILQKHQYTLSMDSLSAEYRGNLFFYNDNDSLRCEIELRDAKDAGFVLDSFMKEPEGSRNVRRSLRNFSICLLILNAITSILFFVRSS
ncbi:MAG: hypothetical protein U5N56_01305 [Candidatus Marinimicrobia bacterium]|nr:hypothetical protein [Candidatus Neomarinimicrobiota bacterium]